MTILARVLRLAAAGLFAVGGCGFAAAAQRTVILPSRLLAGEPATLAVVDADGTLVPGVPVQISGSGQVTTNATGRATFLAPPQAGVFTAQIQDDQTPFTAAVLPADHPSDRGESVPAPPTAGIAFPRVIALTDRFELGGTDFVGDADRDRVLLGDQPAFVLAASPVSLVVLPNPHTVPGETQLRLDTGARSFGASPVTVVSLELTGPAQALGAGQKGALSVRVTGTTNRLAIEVRNGSPEAIRMPRGDVERLTTSGGEQNSATVEITGVKAGDYVVSARLAPGAVALPDWETARKDLLAARQIANTKWRQRIDPAIRGLQENPQEAEPFRTEIARWMADHPPANVAKLLRDASDALAVR